MDLLALVAIATAPGVAIGVYIYLKDKHEREPIGLLLRAFLFGAIGVLLTLLISTGINSFISIQEHNLTEQAIHAFLIVALVEEFSKFLFVPECVKSLKPTCKQGPAPLAITPSHPIQILPQASREWSLARVRFR